MKVFKIKTGNPDTYKNFNDLSNSKIIVEHLIQYENEIEIGSPVFFMFGGDSTPWENGLAGICRILSLPIDLGYETAKYYAANNHQVFSCDIVKPIDDINITGYKVDVTNIQEIEELKSSIERRKKLLSNENYVTKAPQNIVDAERIKLKEEEEQLEKLTK